MLDAPTYYPTRTNKHEPRSLLLIPSIRKEGYTAFQNMFLPSKKCPKFAMDAECGFASKAINAHGT
jgi:hypothetical protein